MAKKKAFIISKRIIIKLGLLGLNIQMLTCWRGSARSTTTTVVRITYSSRLRCRGRECGDGGRVLVGRVGAVGEAVQVVTRANILGVGVRRGHWGQCETRYASVCRVHVADAVLGLEARVEAARIEDGARVGATLHIPDEMLRNDAAYVACDR